MRAFLMGQSIASNSGAGLLAHADSGASLWLPNDSGVVFLPSAATEECFPPPPGVSGTCTVGVPPPRMIKDWRRHEGVLVLTPAAHLAQEPTTSSSPCVVNINLGSPSAARSVAQGTARR
jgi:hypothetical protein